MDPEKATLAHNLSLDSLRELRLARLRVATKDSSSATWHDLLPGPAVDQEDVQCAKCHREHQGADGDLLAISDHSCQTCHADRFGSFASSHPDWTQWPYGRGGTIAFNHSTHANKHFPNTLQNGRAASFDCAQCHERQSNNEVSRSASYEQACRSCHDNSLKIQAAEGLALLALPTLSEDAAAQLNDWPESATGFFDGSITPLAEFLIRHDPEMMNALRQIPNRDLSQISPEDRDSITAASTLAKGHRRLLDDFSIHGQSLVVDRSLQPGTQHERLSKLLHSLSPQLIQRATELWFPAMRNAQSMRRGANIRQMNFQTQSASDSLLLEDDTTSGRDSLLESETLGDTLLSDPLLGDPLAEDDSLVPLGDELLEQDPLSLTPSRPDPLAQDDALNDSDEVVSRRFDAARMLPAGGWYRDDLTFAIRYRGSGHADPVLRTTIEMISELSAGDPVRERMLRSPSVAACASCHPGAIEDGGSWTSTPLIGNRREFTKFSHAAHLNVAQLADCRHCHQVESETPDSKQPVRVVDFAPLTRADCSECHTPHAAGDSCTKCHRYHIDLR